MKRAVWLPGFIFALVVAGLAPLTSTSVSSIEPSQDHASRRWRGAPGAPHPPARAQFRKYRDRRHRPPALDSKDPSGHTILDGVLLSPVTPGHTQLHLRWRHRTCVFP